MSNTYRGGNADYIIALFDEHLDSTYECLEIGGLTFSPSEVLLNLAEGAYFDMLDEFREDLSTQDGTSDDD